MTGTHKGPGRPALPEGERRSARLGCWVTPAEHAACEAAAKDSEQTRSDWVRAAALQALWVRRLRATQKPS